MNGTETATRKGVFFTLDAVFGLLILVTIYGVFALLTIETVSAEALHQGLHIYAEDMVDTMSKVKLHDLRNEPIVMEILTESTAMDMTDMDKSVLDAVGALWATNDPENMRKARTLIQVLFKNTAPTSVEWGIQIKNAGNIDTAYNTSGISTDRYMSAVSRRMVSGYMKGNPHTGFAARAFLSNMMGKTDTRYLFFGGFVGQGNISAYVRDIPSDANVTELYLELSLGNDTQLFVNGTYCMDLLKSPGNFTVDNWTITDWNCLKNVEKGGDTRIDLIFTNDAYGDPINTSTEFVGGGYARVRFKSDFANFPTLGVNYYHFPGIDGLINLYDSFFVPGNITNISGRIHMKSNYTMFLDVGGIKPFNITGNGSEQVFDLSDENFTSLDYETISLTTIPLRFGTPNLSLSVDSSQGDIMLVNDVSGSMVYCQNQRENCCLACPPEEECLCPSTLPQGMYCNEPWGAPCDPAYCDSYGCMGGGGGGIWEEGVSGGAELLLDAPSRYSGYPEWESIGSGISLKPPPIVICGCHLDTNWSEAQYCGNHNAIYSIGGISYCNSRWNSTCLPSHKPKIESLREASAAFFNATLSNPNNRVGIVEYSDRTVAQANAPDLFIDKLRVYPPSVQPGDTTNFLIVAYVNNSASNVSTGTWVRVMLFNNSAYYNGSIDLTNASGRVIANAYLYGPSLPDRAEVRWNVSLDSNTTIIAWADPQNAIVEFDENNNNKTEQIPVGTPNLKVVQNITVHYDGYYNTTSCPGSEGGIVNCTWYGNLSIDRRNRLGHSYRSSNESVSSICRNFTRLTITARIDEMLGYGVAKFEVRLKANYTNASGVFKSVLLKCNSPAPDSDCYYNTSIWPFGSMYYPFSVSSNSIEEIGNETLWDRKWVTFYVEVDPNNEVTETNEADNNVVNYNRMLKPDLTAFTSTYPTTVCTTEPTTFDMLAWASLRHRDNGRADNCPVIDSFNSTLYDNGAYIYSQWSTYSESSFMEPGDYDQAISYTYTGFVNATTNLYAHVDYPPVPNGSVDESREDNNVITYTFSTFIEQPDLIVDEFYYIAPNVYLATDYGRTGPYWSQMLGPYHWRTYYRGICFGQLVGPLTVRARVFNRGCASGPFNVSLYYANFSRVGNTPFLKTQLVGGFGTGEIRNVDLTGIQLYTMEPLQLIAWADAWGDYPPAYQAIDESNETNNNMSQLILERPTELVLSEIAVRSLNPADPQQRGLYGGQTYLNVCKEGTTTTTNFVIEANITNTGPCRIYRPFNVTINYSGTNGGNLFNHTAPYSSSSPLLVGEKYSISDTWDGRNLAGDPVWIPGWSAIIVGAADNDDDVYEPGDCIFYSYPPTGSCYSGNNPDQDNINNTYIYFRTPDTAVSKVAAWDDGGTPRKFYINASIENLDNICTAPLFNVSFYQSLSDSFNTGDWANTTIVGPLNPGDVLVTGTKQWYPVFGGGNTYYMHAWSNNASSFVEYETGLCSPSAPHNCDNINETTIAVPVGSAPYYEQLKHILLSPPVPGDNKEGRLQVTDFSVSPEKATCGEPTVFTIRATILNDGNGAAEGSLVFYAGADGIYSIDVPAVPAGKDVLVERTWLGTLRGDMVFKAVVGDSELEFTVKDPISCTGGIPMALFDNGIVRTHPLSSDKTSLESFTNQSDTWFGTCICCGIMNATGILLDQPDNGQTRSMVVMSDGRANTGCNFPPYNVMDPGMTGDAITDTIRAANYSYQHGVLVFTVGFGIDADKVTLIQAADVGGGQYFEASDTEGLVQIYRQVAEILLNLTYSNQILNAVGANQTTLYPDSYLKFTNEPKSPPLGYRDLVVNLEGTNISGCVGNFSVPSAVTPFDVKVTSYSFDRWTKNLEWTSSGWAGWPGGKRSWMLFNITDFGTVYSNIGDPYVIEFDPTTPLPSSDYPGIISLGADENWANVTTGSGPVDVSPECPTRNRVIYRALVSGSVPFTDVLPTIEGMNVTVYYNLNGETCEAEGNVSIPVGKDLPGVPFNSTPVDMFYVYNHRNENALAAAFLGLMERMNFWRANNNLSCIVHENSDPPGTYWNPVDVNIGSEIITRSISINKVPYMYGPVEVDVVTWVK